MAAPVIATVVNVGDGLRLDATLQAAPAGAVTFRRSRLPGLVGDLVPATLQSGLTYRVQVRDASSPDGLAVTNRRFYYLTAYDGVVESDVQNGQWLCVGSNLDRMHLVEDTMLAILRDNVLALDAGLQLAVRKDTFPDGSAVRVQKLHRGLPEAGKDSLYPAISVRCFSEQQALFWGNPYTDDIHPSGNIHVYYLHQSDHSLEFVVRTLAQAVVDVVNTVSYIEMPLWTEFPRLVARAFHCSNMTSSETLNNDMGVWIAAADIEWDCRIVGARPE